MLTTAQRRFGWRDLATIGITITIVVTIFSLMPRLSVSNHGNSDLDFELALLLLGVPLYWAVNGFLKLVWPH